MTDPGAPLPLPIIRGVEKSRPPIYPPELKSLLCSDIARTTKALTPKKLVTPPKLPERADPKSEEARLLGPFSKRREVNMRWRFYTTEIKKVLPPLQLQVEEKRAQGTTLKTDPDTVNNLGIRPIGFQGQGVFEEVARIAGNLVPLMNLPRRERQAQGEGSPPTTGSPHFSSLPRGSTLSPRFVRRRFQTLLFKLPIFSYSYSKPKEGSPPSAGHYTVTQSPNALSQETRYLDTRCADAEPVEIEWLLAHKQKRQNSNRVDAKQGN